MAEDRRRFLAESAIALLGGPSLLVTACDSGAPAQPTPPQDLMGVISINHGHEARITAAQLAQEGALHLEIQGVSGHGHILDLTADEVARIRRGEVVTALSAPGWEDKHDHRVTFNA